MARRGSKSKSKGSSNKGSRQKDRDDEEVEFVSMGEPVFIDRPGSNNFIQIERKQTVGKKSGNVKGEFVQLQPGFYNDDDEPRFQKGVKGVTWNPAMTGEIMEALEDTMTEEEFEAWEAEQDDEED